MLATIPIHPESKRPACAWKHAQPGEQLHTPGRPYGHLTGERSGGLVVIDVDVKNGDGFATLERLEAEVGPLPDTFCVDTSSGGMHLYYLRPDYRFKSQAGEIGEHVDVRGEGGFVVREFPGYMVSSDLPIATLPDAWAEFLPKAGERKDRPASGPVDFEPVKKTREDLKSLVARRKGGAVEFWRLVTKGGPAIRASGHTIGPDFGPVDPFLVKACGWLAAQDDWAFVSRDSFLSITAPSWSLLQLHDREAGNDTYEDDHLWHLYQRVAAESERAVQRETEDQWAGILERAVGKAAAPGSEGRSEGPRILQIQNAYYLRDADQYYGPYLQAELYGQARDRDVFPVDVPTKHGSRPMRPLEMVEYYGQGGALDEVYYSHVHPEPDLTNRRLRLPACRPTIVEPVYHEDIDTWLRMLGGYPLMDWICVARDLEYAAPALWLTGPAGVGKSLLERGLAGLWGQARAVPMETALARFNLDLKRCPLISAEESLPVDNRGNPLLDQLKRLITATSHRLEPKGLPHVELQGALRVLLSSNNTDMIQGDRDTTLDDASALAARFIHLEPSEAEGVRIREELARHGHTIQRDWVDGGALTRHLAWVIENREPPPFGDRLRLKAFSDSLHNALRTRPGGGFYVMRSIYRWVVDSANAVENGGRPEETGIRYMRDGSIRAKAFGIKQRLEADKGRMNDRTLGHALRRVSTRRVRTVFPGFVHAHKAWDIDLQCLRVFARESAWGDTEELDTALNTLAEWKALEGGE